MLGHANRTRTQAEDLPHFLGAHAFHDAKDEDLAFASRKVVKKAEAPAPQAGRLPHCLIQHVDVGRWYGAASPSALGHAHLV